HGHLLEKAQALAVFSNEGNARGARFGRMGKVNLIPCQDDPPLGRLGTGAEQAFEQLRPSRTHQAGNTQYLTAAKLKANVLQPPATCMAGPGQVKVLHFEDNVPTLPL